MLNEDEGLADLLDKKRIFISLITELELLSFQYITIKEEKVIREFLSHCKIITINSAVKQEAIRIRKKYNTKLPDSIIIGTALFLGLPLMTADEEYKKVVELNLINYQT